MDGRVHNRSLSVYACLCMSACVCLYVYAQTVGTHSLKVKSVLAL
jgi:hypothetical protein